MGNAKFRSLTSLQPLPSVIPGFSAFEIAARQDPESLEGYYVPADVGTNVVILEMLRGGHVSYLTFHFYLFNSFTLRILIADISNPVRCRVTVLVLTVEGPEVRNLMVLPGFLALRTVASQILSISRKKPARPRT